MESPNAQAHSSKMEGACTSPLECSQNLSNPNLQKRKQARRLSITNRELLLVASEGDLEKVDHLLDLGADINFSDRDGNTVLHWALESGNSQCFNMLRSKGSKGAECCKNNANEAPIDLAKRLGREDLLEAQDEESLYPHTIDENSLHFPSLPLVFRQKVGRIAQSNKEKRSDPVHGNIYQIKVLMLFLYRGVSHQYSFRLGTEIEEAKKFDDLVFEYTRDGRIEYRLLQAKHRLDESKKITADSLFTETDGDYSLTKYFFSYQDAKKEKLFKAGSIKDVTICTNIDFDFDNLREAAINIEEIRDKDDILDVPTSIRKSKRYRFSPNVAGLLKPRLRSHNLNKLARRLTECLLTNSSIKDHESSDIFKVYHLALANEVIDVKAKKFHRKFIDNVALSEDAQKLRQAFEKEILAKSKDQFTLQSINEALTEKTLFDNKPIGLNLSKKFGKGVDVTWPQNVVSDLEVEDFLRQLVFAVNQPNEQELGDIVKDEIGKEFDFMSTENIYNKFFMTMLKWLQGKSETKFLTYENGKEFFEEARVGIHVFFNVRHPVESFTGRAEQLDEVHKLLRKFKGGKTVAVCGLGGVGKSELVRKYVKQHSRDYDNKIVWVNAESYQSLVESFRRLACDKLKINSRNANGEEKEMASVVEEVYKVFSRGRSLFVFDNAEKYKSLDKFDNGINQFLPSLPADAKNPYVLITSRNQKWPKSVDVLRLDAFNEQEAIRFIQRSLSKKDGPQDSDSIELAHKLQLFPLALQQAVAYIKTHDDKLKNVGSEFTIQNYLERFKEKAGKLLDFKFPDDSDNMYSQSIFATWNVTLDAISLKESGSDALEVLNVAAYLAPEDIPTELLLLLVSSRKNLGSAIELLKQFSMISQDQPGVFTVHSLVQHVTRIKLKEQVREEHVLRRALSSLLQNNLGSKSLEHVISIWNYATKYKELLKDFYSLSNFIAAELGESARYDEAILFSESVFHLLKPLLYEVPGIGLAILTIENNIAVTLLEQGKYDLGLRRLQKVLEVQENHLTPDHDEILRTKNNIALSLFKLDRHNEALDMYKELFATSKRQLGESDRDTLFVRHAIAGVHFQQGNNDKALQIFREVYATQKRTLGENYPDTINTKKSIACVLAAQCEYDQALEIYREILTCLEHAWKPNHPQILNTKKLIAGVLLNQGKYKDARKIYEEALKVERGLLENCHPNILRTQRDLASVLKKEGYLDRALEICLDIFHIQKQTWGCAHLETLETQSNIALIYAEKGQFDEALREHREVLTKRKVTLGNDCPPTLRTRNCIAVILAKKGKQDEALLQYQEVLKAQSSQLGPNHVDTLHTKNNLGMVYNDKKEYAKALVILKEVYEQMNKMYPADHPDTLSARMNIGLVLANQEELNAALVIFREVLETQEALLEKGHASIVGTKTNIAGVLLKQRKHNEARKLLKHISSQSNQHPDTQYHPALIDVEKTILSLTEEAESLLSTVKRCNIEQLEKLLANGADVNTQDTEDNTLLHLASKKSTKMVEILLSYAAVYNTKNQHDKTPLDVSTDCDVTDLLLLVHMLFEDVQKDDLKIIEKLKKIKENPDKFSAVTCARNQEGNTLLKFAVENQNHVVARELVKLLKK